MRLCRKSIKNTAWNTALSCFVKLFAINLLTKFNPIKNEETLYKRLNRWYQAFNTLN